MLTVKHIAPVGHEHIWPAIRVSYQPRIGSDTPPTIFIDRPGERGLVDTIDVGAPGTWYVMNDQGKTIARYELDNGPAASMNPNFTLSSSGNNITATHHGYAGTRHD